MAADAQDHTPASRTAAVSDASAEFTRVAADRRAEAPKTLAEPVPQSLTIVDQFGLWGNLGVSLLGFTAAIFVLQPLGAGTPELSLAAAVCALIVGTLLGTLPVALAGVQGARTGAPAMVLLRGLFGARLSYLPTALNILQLLGWSVFELVTIATAAHTIAPRLPKPGYVLIAGVITAALTIRPLGAIRVLRRYATVAVMIVGVYLLVQFLRHPLPAFSHGTWSGFWVATDTVVGAGISWVPLAADYTRHSRSPRAAAAGALVGYSVTQVLCYMIGLLALVTVARNPADIYGAFIALPVGALAFAILAARELDQSFADVYSTAVSLQNLRPLWDRRVLAVTITAACTAGALWLNISDYENFLILIGSVFVPLSAVLIVDYFVIARGRWNLSARAGTRWAMLAPWAAGFVMYQMVNPGYVAAWASAWSSVDKWLGFTPQSWMSASILSFVASAVVTAALGWGARLAGTAKSRSLSGTRAPDSRHAPSLASSPGIPAAAGPDARPARSPGRQPALRARFLLLQRLKPGAPPGPVRPCARWHEERARDCEHGTASTPLAVIFPADAGARD